MLYNMEEQLQYTEILSQLLQKPQKDIPAIEHIDRYARPGNISFDHPLYIITEHADCSGFSDGYSFDAEIFNDCIIRRKRILDKCIMDSSTQCYVIGKISQDEENKDFSLETALTFISDLSEPLHVVSGFLNDITSGPSKIIHNKNHQLRFLEYAKILKNNNISSENAANISHDLNKSYKFNRYILYNTQNSLITLNYGSYNKEGGFSFESEDMNIKNLDFISLLNVMHKSGFIGINFDKVEELKSDYKGKIINLRGNREKNSGLRDFREVINFLKNHPTPILSLNENTPFSEVLSVIDKDNLLLYFPFKSDVELAFIRDIVNYHYR